MAVIRVLSLVALAVAAVRAQETHTITMKNYCGKGTPQLIVGGKLVSSGDPYTHSGQPNGIAYLQTGECLFNGENCSIVEMFLGNPNPAAPGSGSSTDISLIPSHAFNVPVGFSYNNGCDGQGTVCHTATCATAFFHPDDTWVQVACQANNVNLEIEFCPGGGAPSPPPASSSAAPPPPPPSPTSSTEKAAPPPPATTQASTSAPPPPPKPTPTPTSTNVFVAPAPSTTASPSSSHASVASSTTIVVKSTSPASASALPSGTPNRKTCKPGQKMRKRNTATPEPEQIEKREAALRAHRRAGHHH